MKIKITNNRIWSILNNMKQLGEVIGSTKFNRGILKNRGILQEHFREVQSKVKQPDPAYYEYIDARKQLIDTFQAEVKTANEASTAAPSKQEHDDAILGLNTKYASTLEDFKAEERKTSLLMEAEVELDIHAISEEDIPDMSLEKFELIDPLISE